MIYNLKSNTFFACLLAILIVSASGCRNTGAANEGFDSFPAISPDYSGITIPPNIAPLNFVVNEEGRRYRVGFYDSDNNGFKVKSRNKTIRIPAGKWKRLLDRSAGSEITTVVQAKRNGRWISFRPVVNNVAEHEIDGYLVYRLIEPGFEMWGKMGIYQRSLESFRQKPIMINTMSNHNCMNCHSFAGNDSKTMMFHMRGRLGGTIVYREGTLEKLDTKTDETISAGVYPSWHPDGRFIAFSVNKITQCFHAIPGKRIEVIDTLSDVIVYDTRVKEVLTCDALSAGDRLETFPSWSPDGKYLYFCSAKLQPLQKFDSIRYDLMRIPFDPEAIKFGNIETVVSSALTGLSVSFPRISPDGRYVLFCMSDYGNFTIWHADSDLYLLDLETGEITKPDINSDQAESYHSWSSDGRWIVFSSRRKDGLFTRSYMSFFDPDGKAHKPFLLPQRNPVFYDTFLKSYNVPELIRGKVDLNPRKIRKIALTEPAGSLFRLSE